MTQETVTDEVIVHDDARPPAFTTDQLGWLPWLKPLRPDELTERQRAALIEPSRAHFPYFALLARDPDALEARTLTDLDIFTNPDGGVPRPEREWAAAVASRVNGCVFCASVHARQAVALSGGEDGLLAADVHALLTDGPDAEVAPRLAAIAEAAAALTATPPAFGPEHIGALREAGLDDVAIGDVVSAAAFFNWANRLMLSLGEPRRPKATREGRAS